MTKDEQKRTEIFEAESAKLLAEGFVTRNLLISGVKANTLGTLFGIVPVIPFAIWYMLVYGGFDAFSNAYEGTIVIIALLLSIPAHELIHGITWSLFTRNRFKSIAFGVAWSSLTPYCSCKEGLKRMQYLFGTVMPGIVLGLIPLIISCINGSASLFAYAAFMTITAGGDLMICSMILRDKKAEQEYFLDHPTKIGLVKFEKT